jgi:hypothetical protein
MKQFTINIGLNNNPFTAKKQDGNPSIAQEQILNLLKLAFPYASELYRIETGEWDGEKEPTFIGYVDADAETIDKKVQLLCDIMTQICIPYYSESKSNLVYESFFTGEKYTFNKEYFIF